MPKLEGEHHDENMGSSLVTSEPKTEESTLPEEFGHGTEAPALVPTAETRLMTDASAENARPLDHEDSSHQEGEANFHV
jgi:hypothetical protein